MRRAGRCVIGVCMIDVGQRQLRGDSSDDVANVQFHLLLSELIGWNRIIHRCSREGVGDGVLLAGPPGGGEVEGCQTLLRALKSRVLDGVDRVPVQDRKQRSVIDHEREGG